MTVDRERPGYGADASVDEPASVADLAVALAPASEQGVAPAPSPRLASRDVDLRLAHLHLRLGSVDLARAELEAAQVDAPLPAESLADLAEARWRGGDLRGAGDAVRQAIAAGSTSPVAAVIRIETDGPAARPWTTTGDLPITGLTAADVDRIFAGLPRSAAWPPDSTQPRQAGPEAEAAAPPRPRTPPGRAADVVSERFASAPRGRNLPEAPSDTSFDEPSSELDAAAGDLALGADDVAAIRLAVLIRTRPSAAPAVSELLEDATSPALLIVRGDALRVLGRAAEAERAWASAAASLDTVRSGGGPARATGASPASEGLRDAMTAPPPTAPALPLDVPRQAAESGSEEPTGPSEPARRADHSISVEPDDPAVADSDRPRPRDPNSNQEEPS